MIRVNAREFVNKIESLPNEYILTSHINPDGDGLGAMFAMGAGLKVLGKVVHYVLDEPVRDYYECLPEHEHLVYDFPDIKGDFVIMSFDCGSLERMALPDISHLRNRVTLINLDHHLSNTIFGDINFLVVDSIASCELVYQALLEMPIEVTSEMATCLYMGLMYDTGRFAYSPKPEAFDLASNLLRHGADHWKVYTSLFRHNTLEEYKVNGDLYQRLQEHEGGKLVTLDIDEKLTDRINLEETENLINKVSNIKDLQVVIFFKFIEKGLTKVSFRSRGDIDVCALASHIGGGGHKNASGALVQEEYHVIREKVFKMAREVLQ